MESNLIYRDVTVALLKDEEYPCENDYDEGFMAALDKAIWIVEKYTASAEPEKRTEERTETHSCDCIERQAALDAIFSEPLYESGMKKRDADAVVPAIYEKIKSLPSTQPDYTELKREFIRMAGYIDVLLECSDVQKETLIGFISRLAEFMPWTERD